MALDAIFPRHIISCTGRSAAWAATAGRSRVFPTSAYFSWPKSDTSDLGGIHVSTASACRKVVDGRNKSGHDVKK